MDDAFKDLRERIASGKAVVGVLGLGYTGLPLALALIERFRVIGFDTDAQKVEAMRAGRSPVDDVPDGVLAKALNEKLTITTDPADLKGCDAFIICVPTPLGEAHVPDLSFVEGAGRNVASVLHTGTLVILESTTYPGTTEEVLVPILETSGLRCGVDVAVAFSPERVDPGSLGHGVVDTPKVVGGLTPAGTGLASSLLAPIIPGGIVEVADARTAEATKMLENIFRGVNIALINEMALIFERLGIDTWEVVRAASTKPFGFMPHYPGPGIGGHCIPLDPFYLSYQAKRHGIIPRFIELAGEINEFMRVHAVNLVETALGKKGVKLRGATVTVLGLAYKGDIADTRESPAATIIEELRERGAKVRAFDPMAQKLRTGKGDVASEGCLEDALKDSDCALVVTPHTAFRNANWASLIKGMRTPVIVDCRNIVGKVPEGTELVVLGKGET